MVYPEELKTDIVAQYKNGVSVKQLSTEYGICVRTIYRWANIYGGNQAAEISNDPQQYSAKEYHNHVRRITKLENIISVLKTVNCTVHAPLKERLLELEQLYGQYDVHTLCEALEVSRGTFYNHILRNKRSNAWFEKRREEYRVLVQEVFDEYRQVLGAEKIRAILVQRGHKVSTAYVASLLRDMGLASVRTSAKHDYRKIQELEKKKNILQQQFKADRPNQIWVSDVTCFTPPPLDGSDASKKFLSERFPSSTPSSHITLPDTAADLLAQYDEACEELEIVTEKKQRAENLLKEMMGSNEVGVAGGRVITWKNVEQERLDSKTLKAEHPALCKKYTSKTSYRRFTIKEAS